MPKKNKSQRKVPEKSISDKVNHYKGLSRNLKKRIDNLEKRLFTLEERMNKYKKLLPSDKPLDFGTSPEKRNNKQKDDFLKQLKEEFGKKDGN